MHFKFMDDLCVNLIYGGREGALLLDTYGASGLMLLLSGGASCWELLSMGRGLARGDRRGWRRRVGEAAHPSTYVPND